tara:strand:+ start:692 stop:1153 length:462 start_codon:yes stop_codon:yes gene_type:complete
MLLKPVSVRLGCWSQISGNPIDTWISVHDRRKLKAKAPIDMDLYELVDGIYVEKDYILSRLGRILDVSQEIGDPLKNRIRISQKTQIGEGRTVGYFISGLVMEIGYGNPEELGNLEAKYWVLRRRIVEEEVGVKDYLEDKRALELSLRRFEKR